MSPWTGEAAALASRIRAFVAGAVHGRAPEPFEALALDLHRWQSANDPVHASLVDREVRTWLDIPAIPVGLFRELPVGTWRGPPGTVFRTSGTTGGRGEHHLRSTALSDLGAVAWARRCVPGLGARTVALLEDPATAPDSSLSHMVAAFGPASWHVRAGVLQARALRDELDAARVPLFVPATAFALAEWLDLGPPALPLGSTLMVTGGFKGRRAEVAPDALWAQVRASLRPARIVTEYGMTELSSQLWGTPELPYLPPPWLRVVAVDPDGRALPPGEAGQLRFWDLCNLDGAVAIETLDEGVVHPDGAVTLRGRLAGAVARGCSLTVEEAWSLRSRG